MNSALWQLVLMRLRMWRREPEGLFWMFLFPLLTTAVLGVAFRNQEPEPIPVAIIQGEGSEALRTRVATSTQLAVQILPEAEARIALRKGNVAALLVAGPELRLIQDSGKEGSVAAALLVRDALDRSSGGAGLPEISTKAVTEPGSRFVDFLVPGMLGFSLLNTSLSELAFVLAQMRSSRLLKRFAATPLRTQTLLGAFLLVRGLMALVEVLFYCVMARFLFGVPMQGSYPTFMLVALVGAASFTGLSLLVAGRAKSAESVSGLSSLISFPMVFLSGVFFSSDRFPEWIQPALSLLPLSALNDALRGVMLDGMGIAAVAGELGILAVWGVVTFVGALRLFRWQ